MSDTTDRSGAAHRRRDPRVDWQPVALIVSGVLAVLLIVAGILGLLGVFTPSAASPPQSSLVGSTLNTFALPRVNGTGELTAPWSRGRAAVILFFGDYCTPCHDEVPLLAGAVGRGDLSGVQIVGVDEDAQLSTARSFVRSSHVHFEVGIDHFSELAANLVPGGLPASIFVTAKGRVVSVHYGVLSIEQLSAGLSELRRAQGS